MHAILLVARAELRRRWLSLVVIGVLAGMAGAAVAGAAALARRTATADERLYAATNADDVRTLVIGGTSAATEAIGAEAVAVPGVADGRVALGGVARLGGEGVVYISVLVGPERWGEDVLSPVVSAGRLPDPERPDEVVVNDIAVEQAPERLGIGRQIELRFLSVTEFTQFDAEEPLEGRAGTQTATIVGTIRFPGEGDDLPPIVGTPALAAAVPEGIGVLGAALLRLEPGADSNVVQEAVNKVGTSVERPEVVDDQPPIVSAGSSAQLQATTSTTTTVISFGLLVLAGAAAVAGLLAVGQAAARHNSATSEDQGVESAIGMTSGQRVAARLLASAGPIALAGLLTTIGGLTTAGIEPPGILRLAEPAPGWAPNVLLVGMIASAVVLLTAGLLAATTASSGSRGRRGRAIREAPVVSRLAAVGARPPTILGLRFALERGARTGGSTRAAIVGVAVTVAGVLACATYLSSLSRVERTPLRFGWPTDLEIADAAPALARELAADGRFDTVLASRSADLRIDGQSYSGLSLEPLLGEVEWHLASGRPPATVDEIVVGTRTADELGVATGDVVTTLNADDQEQSVTVVGVAVLPVWNGGLLGRGVAMTADGIEEHAINRPYDEVGLSTTDGVDAEEVAEELGADYEVAVAELPRDVANLSEIDRVPLLLGAFFGLLGIALLGHSVLVTMRRRHSDLSAMRAMGFTPRQLGTTVLVMAATITAIGSVLAVPFGLALGSTVWRVVAEGAALIGDPDVPWSLALLAVPASLAVGLALALGPATRRVRLAVTGGQPRD